MSAQKCQDLIISLNEYSCAPEFAEQMRVARELYAIATGKVNDDDPFYDQRMAAFQEYFLFDYRLSAVFSGSTVLETFLLNAQTNIPPTQLNEFEQLRNFRHSLFKIQKVRSDCLHVVDMLAETNEVVWPLPDCSFAGFEANQVFEARLVNFEGVNYFTGGFIFHPKEVRQVIEKHVAEFLAARVHCSAQEDVDWRGDLDRRHDLLASVSEQKRQAEMAERKRAIDMLNVTKQLVGVSRVVQSPNLVMAIGRDEEISPFVPETPLYDTLTFLQKLAYCEIRSYRYRHIDPVKVYSFEEDFKSLAPKHGFIKKKTVDDNAPVVPAGRAQ